MSPSSRRGEDAPASTSFDGVVLCGGESRRMGKDKALLPIDGSPMAVRVAEALRAAGAARVVAIGGDGARLAEHGLLVVPDLEPGAGPLAATIQALDGSGSAIVAVLGCDLVAPSGPAILKLVDALAGTPHAVGAIPVVDGHRQWVHAAWRITAAPLLRCRWRDGLHSLRRAAEGLPILEVHDLPAAALADADDPSQLPASPRAAAASLALMDVPEIDIATLAQLREQDVALIDVREDDEYEGARVPGARHIPLGQVADRVAEVPTDGTVYVICARGGRSAKAVEHYRSLGIDAVNVAGGTLAWIDAGHPTDSGPGSGAQPA